MLKKILISIIVFLFPVSIMAAVKPANKKIPLTITSNRVWVLRRKNTITFYTDVVATQDKFTLMADKMVVFYREDKNKKMNIEKIEAQKNVKFMDGVVIATGDIGWYELGENKIILQDNIKATEKGITLTAERFEYDVLTEKTKIIGNNNPNERVTIILDNIGKPKPEEETEENAEADENNENTGDTENEGN